MGGTFLVMGVPALVMSLWWLVRDRGSHERLQKLRESGALTDAEFQAEKAKILGE